MKRPLLVALLFSLTSAGCVMSPRASSPPVTPAPTRFDLITVGMTKRLVLEVLGAPKSETAWGHLRWEDRYDEDNFDSLEVGFDPAGAIIFLEKTTSKQTTSRP